MTDVALEVYEADNATLAGTVAAGQWAGASVAVIPLGGYGTVDVPRIIAAGAANPVLSLLTVGRLLRFSGDFGAWTMEIEDVDDTVVSEREEAGEVVQIKGRDWLTARAAKTHLLPDAGLGVEPHYPTRWFNFSADRLRDDDPDGPQGAWPFGVNQAPDYDTNNHFGRPEGYVDTSGEWIADRDSRTLYAPGGVWYFRGRVTLASDHDAVLVQYACDDEGELWIDGVPVCRVEGVYKGGAVQASIPMGAGEHLISGWCRNLNELRTGAIGAGWSVSDGMADTLLWRLDETYVRVLGFPSDPPGFTPTEVIRLVVDEEQDAGGLTGVGFSFISASDTARQPVSEVTDIAARAPGSSLLTFLQMLAASYLDIDGDPESLTIDAWVRGTRGNRLLEQVILVDESDVTITDENDVALTVEAVGAGIGVTLEKGTALSVKHTAQGSERATVALVEGSSFAPFEVQHADYLTLGRTVVALDFGDASKATATKWAGEYLEVVAEARRGIEVALHPGGDFIPGDTFGVGDTIGVLDTDGTITEHRVAGWGFEIDGSSIVRYSCELGQPAVLLQERLDAIMRRFLPGGAGGRTILPSPVEPSFPAQTEGRESTQTWSTAETGTIVLRKNTVAIPGASIAADGRVTLTDPAREFTKNSDRFDITVGGAADFPEWEPTDGRWVQEMSAVQGTNGIVVTIKYA